MNWAELDPLGYLDDDYLDSPIAWDVLAKVLRRARIVGLDSEFYGLDVRKQSCVNLARIHVWSVAIRTTQRSPLGFTKARGWVLPIDAALHPSLRAVLEDASITKCVHNQSVDDHAFHNHLVELKGCINTLGLSRWVWPELVTAGGFGLKNLMMVKLGRAPICEFLDVVSDTRPIVVVKTKTRKRKVCDCGEAKCRKRKGHTKTEIEETYEDRVDKIEKFRYALEVIVIGHKRWLLLVKYAAEDAVAALEVEELARRQRDPAPFPYVDNGAGPANMRPKFNQAVENAIVAMEREGFPVDTKWCFEQLETARADEKKQLDWLHKWFEAFGADAIGVKEREDVDAIWSSPKQLLALFDALDFPRSPIWKKGKVKPGEVKLDGTALGWIAKNHKESAQFVRHIMLLKRIRSGIKYLTKMGNSGGWVHPICGPAGDGDDRNGALTGRLGIKGVLEAQQLPTREEVDLYHVRKAIVAEDMRGEI